MHGEVWVNAPIYPEKQARQLAVRDQFGERVILVGDDELPTTLLSGLVVELIAVVPANRLT